MLWLFSIIKTQPFFVFTDVHSEQVQQVVLNLPSYRGQLISFELYKRQSNFAFPWIMVSLPINAQSQSIQQVRNALGKQL